MIKPTSLPMPSCHVYLLPPLPLPPSSSLAPAVSAVPAVQVILYGVESVSAVLEGLLTKDIACDSSSQSNSPQRRLPSDIFSANSAVDASVFLTALPLSFCRVIDHAGRENAS